ncbi:MAG TPA: hypothetical protein VEJ47_00090 [Candidatus Eremiobacteraceae bacterium]|nr:hypothetical protein [Candidatus Eremiobacteraceae bacterium]
MTAERPQFLTTRTTFLMREHAEAAAKLPPEVKTAIAKLAEQRKGKQWTQ